MKKRGTVQKGGRFVESEYGAVNILQGWIREVVKWGTGWAASEGKTSGTAGSFTSQTSVNVIMGTSETETSCFQFVPSWSLLNYSDFKSRAESCFCFFRVLERVMVARPHSRHDDRQHVTGSFSSISHQKPSEAKRWGGVMTEHRFYTEPWAVPDTRLQSHTVLLWSYVVHSVTSRLMHWDNGL